MKPLHRMTLIATSVIVGLTAAPKAIGLVLMSYYGSTHGLAEGGPVDFEKLRADVKAAMDEIGGKVKDLAQQAIAEAKKSGDLSAALKDKVDEAIIKQTELQARMLEVEQKQAAATDTDETAPQSLGQLVVGSEEFKEFMKGGGANRASASMVTTVPHATIISVPTTNTTTVGVPPDIVPGVFPGTQRRLTVRDLLAPGRTDSNLIQYVKESGFTNNAAMVSEGDEKPQSELTYELVQSAVRTLAHFFKASKQILDDFSGLQSQIDQRGRYGLKLVEENQLLKGSGAGNNLNGVYTQATAYSPPFALPAGFTKIDVLRLMILQAELAEYPPDGIVLHPADWAAIELTKTNDRAYIFANPQGTVAARMWGLPVVPTQAMTIDTALVGAFKLGAQIFDREDANVVISTENDKDFIKNLITIRIEERLGLAVYRPEAFIKNTNLPAS